MIDHIEPQIADAARSRAFYTDALAPLGYAGHADPAPGVVGMGTRFPDFWIGRAPHVLLKP